MGGGFGPRPGSQPKGQRTSMTVNPIMTFEGAGYVIPARDPAHADPQWFEMGLDDEIEDPDSPFVDPLPTERHRRVPGFEG